MPRPTPLKAVALAAILLTLALRTDNGMAQWRGVGGPPSDSPPAASEPAAPASTPGIVFPSGTSVASSRSSPAAQASGVRLAGASLPADQGQVWREYDISPYTMRVTSTQRPEQAIVDWILRETGYEAWHSETVSILSATPRQLRVYHTPAIQAVVASVVDRFVGDQAGSHAFGLRVVSVNNPNWRAKAQGLLHPVAVQTPGVQAWILRKEDAAILLAELRRRSDFREHSSPYLMVHNGQPSAVTLLHPKTYVRDVIRRPEVWPGFQPESAQIDEGLALEFCPLLAPDAQSIDATIKCTVTQVEKTVPVVLDIPTATETNQRTKIEVPQISHFRFHERFRWPTDQVLVISMGMVAEPAPTVAGTLASSLPLGLGGNSGRADLLVMVESKPQDGTPASPTETPVGEAKTYRGRY